MCSSEVLGHTDSLGPIGLGPLLRPHGAGLGQFGGLGVAVWDGEIFSPT